MAPAGDSDVAVVFSGWLAVAVPRRGESTRDNLISPLHADAFLAATYLPSDCQRAADGPPAGHGGDCLLPNIDALRPWLVALSIERMLSRRRLRAMLELSAPRLLRDALSAQLAQSAPAYNIFNPVVGNRNISCLRELHDYARVLRLLGTHEARRRREYERVVFSRLEFEWLAPHPPLDLMEARYVWLPSGGVLSPSLNDRHAVLSRRAAHTYLGRWATLVSDNATRALVPIGEAQGLMPP